MSANHSIFFKTLKNREKIKVSRIFWHIALIWVSFFNGGVRCGKIWSIFSRLPLSKYAICIFFNFSIKLLKKIEISPKSKPMKLKLGTHLHCSSIWVWAKFQLHIFQSTPQNFKWTSRPKSRPCAATAEHSPTTVEKTSTVRSKVQKSSLPDE